MPTTTNFGWTTPADTDLVKDGALAIRTLGNGIDTSMVDLKGGTTGQVLSKASNTDMDFTWVAQDDSNAIQNAIVDAKGDLISATAADTPARLAVGTNGQVLTADSTTSTGLKWATAQSGGYTLLSTTTLSGTLTTVSSISQDYVDLYLLLYGVTASADFSTVLKPNGSGSNSTQRVVGSSTNTTTNTANVTYWTSTGSSALSTGGNNIHVLRINNYASTSTWKAIDAYGLVETSTDVHRYRQSGGYTSTSAVTSIEIDAGGTITFSGGTLKIYGVK